MSNKEHSEKVVEQFGEQFLENVEALTGISLEVKEVRLEHGRPYRFNNQMSVFIDLNGSVMGFLSIICKEDSAASLLEIPQDEVGLETREEYGPFMSELLNVVGGSLLEIVNEEYPLVTLTSPRTSFGSLDFPQSQSCSKIFTTDHGEFELYFATDSMSLKVVELLEKVKSQKEAIQLILDTIPSALLTFDLNCTLGEQCSRRGEYFFGDDVGGKDASEVLFNTERDSDDFKAFMNLIPNSPLPFEEITPLAPSRSTIYKGKERLELQYAYSAIYSDEERTIVDRVMLIADDITDKIRLQEEAREREERAEFVHKVLKNRDGYIDFLSEALSCLKVIKKASESFDAESVPAAFRASHTIKGNSSLFGITDLRDVANDLENVLTDIRDGRMQIDEVSIQKVIKGYHALEVVLNKHISESENVFGDIFDPRKLSDERYTIHESELKKLITLSDNPTLLSELERIRLKRIYIYLAPFSDMVRNISLKLGKNIAPLKIEGEDSLIDPKRWKSFFASFVHLIRNCADHGIEFPDERLEAKKPETAIISIKVEECSTGVIIYVKDDGRGIDCDVIAKLALSKKIVTQEELTAMSPKEKQLLIFKPGFSTKDEISSLSGRGVGMDAVLHEVKALDGEIDIESVLGQGTTFIIKIPYLNELDDDVLEDSGDKRMFLRMNSPLYLPTSGDDGVVLGHIVNVSPDGFRIVFKSSSDIAFDESDIIVYIEGLRQGPEYIHMRAKKMNSILLDNGILECGYIIVSFRSSADQICYEDYLRQLHT
ncbi:MAG: Hpt domain-containing protein [Planctomycetes bacterium]|nr:Hpt domain-containing protein [Planctomycetota bacterium]